MSRVRSAQVILVLVLLVCFGELLLGASNQTYILTTVLGVLVFVLMTRGGPRGRL